MVKGKDRLRVELAGIILANPTVLASGVLGTTPGGLKLVADAGAGAVTTKSVGSEPRKGHSLPAVVEVEGGYLNAMGLPNPGMENYAKELEEGPEIGAPLIGSIYGGGAEEFIRVGEEIAAHVDLIELNLSCPHAGGLGAAIGSEPSLVERVVRGVTDAVEVPVLAKLTPNVPDVGEIALAAEEGGAKGIAAINTLKGMTIDIETRRPILGNRSGGLSGPAVHPVAVKAVYDIYSQCSIPIVGIGGVNSGEDLVELMLAGASAVGVGTAVANEGLKIFSQLINFLDRYLEGESLSAADLIGLAHGTGEN